MTRQQISTRLWELERKLDALKVECAKIGEHDAAERCDAASIATSDAQTCLAW